MSVIAIIRLKAVFSSDSHLSPHIRTGLHDVLGPQKYLWGVDISASSSEVNRGLAAIVNCMDCFVETFLS